jgi:hypothetical protein
MKKAEIIYYDEVSEWPKYKWYRNPIKKFKFWRWSKSVKLGGEWIFTGYNNMTVHNLDDGTVETIKTLDNNNKAE